jgi:hypothetical protein
MTIYNPAQGPAALRLSAAGKVLQMRRGRRHVTIMGDVSKELMLALSSALR